MQHNKEQREISLRVLVAALDHHAQVMELRERRAPDDRSRNSLAAASRLSTSLSEEIAAIAGIKNWNVEGGHFEDASLIRDLSTAFRVCLDELPLGPVRDHVVQGYLRLRRLNSIC